MTDSKGFLTLLIFTTLCKLSHAQNGPNYLVAVPRQLQCCQPEKVLVSVFKVGGNQIPTRIQVEDESGTVVTQTGEIQIAEGSPEEFQISIPCQNLPKQTDHSTQRYVVVRVVGNHGVLSFNKVTRVGVKASPSLVLIQTDKPVYIEKDEVHILIAVLGCNFTPCCGGDKQCVCDVILDIRNPQNIINDRLVISPCSSRGAMERKNFKLGTSPVEGDWTIIAKRSCDDTVISETFFEVKNNVLPRFDVQIKTPYFVRPGDQNIKIVVTARHTYGKGVQGLLDVSLGICNESSVKALVFRTAQFHLYSKDKGQKTLHFPNGGYDVFPFGKRLCIFAQVTEETSGIKFGNSDNTAQFTDNPIKIDCDLTPPFYRPNLPLKLQVRVRYPNGQLVVDRDVEVEAIQPDGIVKRATAGDSIADLPFDVGNHHGDLSVKVKVKGQTLGKDCVFKEFCSPCGGQISVRPRKIGKLEIGKTANFEIIKAQSDARELQVTVVVIARGSIQSTQSFQSQAGPITTFQVEVTTQLSNRFCVLVYYIETCNQVISDVACMETNKACANEISLSLKDQQVQPGMKATIYVNVSCQNSDIALLAVDKGLYILNSENRLSREKLFQSLENCSSSCGYTVASSDGLFDAVGLAAMSQTPLNPQCGCCTTSCRSACLNPDDQCVAGRRKRDTTMDSECERLRKRAEKETNRYEFCLSKVREMVDGTYRETLDGEVLLVPKTEEAARHLYKCCIGPDRRTRSSFTESFNDIIEMEDPYLVNRRTSFPNFWLQDRVIRNYNLKNLTLEVKVPDSITEWSIYGLAQCCASGFCVSEPVNLKVFKSLFIECHMPFSLKRQEQVSLSCTAYNYNHYSQRACVKVIRPSSNLCTTAGIGLETEPVCFQIEGEETKAVVIPVLPLEVGSTQLTVRLMTVLGGDETVQNINVVPEGITRNFDISVELDPQGVNMDVRGACTIIPAPDIRKVQCFKSVLRSGECAKNIEGNFTKEECCVGMASNSSFAFQPIGGECELCPGKNETHNCEDGVCECGGTIYSKNQVNFFPVRVPEDYIEGSTTAWIGVSGRYFAIDETIEGHIDEIQGVENMLNIPGGSGEASMLRFGPNCAIAAFLRATNPGAEQRYLPLLRDGYRYQLRYRVGTSGAFTLRQGYTPSTWLSSYVLRTMCCAREFVVVDPYVVSGLINFLGTRRGTGGKFTETSNVIHREMVGGVQEGGLSMTAYTGMSLLDCCRPQETPTLRTLVCPSVQYMQNEIAAGRVNRPYAQAIVYNALVKACICGCGVCSTTGICNLAVIAKLRKELFRKVKKGVDGSMHWEADPGVGKAYWYRHQPSAISVEMTAYVLQACICVADCQCARATAKWLNSVRNSRGAFVSTQDTVVALTALSQFAIGCRVTALHPPNLCVDVKLMSKPDQTYTQFRITSQNAELTHRIKVPLNEIIKVDTCGSGLGRAMVHYEYNVPGTAFEPCDFNITVTAKESKELQTHDRFGALPTAEINYCVGYLETGCTSFAVVEVELPTGFEPCDHLENDEEDPLCLRDILLTSWKSFPLSKYEITGTSVVFYFDQICSAQQICVHFKAFKKFEVLHSLPVSIKVFDYYEPAVQCTTFYTLGFENSDLKLLCDGRNEGQPVCICGSGRCAKVEKEIQNRLCNACYHHHYVYNVVVLRESYDNGWFKITVNVSEVLSFGAKPVREGDKIDLWLPSICKQDFDLEIGKCYHLQGIDGDKFILDHNAHLEQCPETTTAACRKDVRTSCIKNPCRKQKFSKKDVKVCERKRKSRCQKKLSDCSRYQVFEDYASKLRSKGHCELQGLCSKRQ